LKEADLNSTPAFK